MTNAAVYLATVLANGFVGAALLVGALWLLPA
jgi:hypothetical protein